MRPLHWQLLFIVSILCSCLITGHVWAASYYVSSAGHDDNDGLSQAQAWKTIERVNRVNLDSGDQILFEAHTRFPGTLELNAEDGGTPQQPVVITSYGQGYATIAPRQGDGIRVHNSGGIKIARLKISGPGLTWQSGVGIRAIADRADGSKFEYLRIAHVIASGFRQGGILVESRHASFSGFHDVGISHCDMFDNGDIGIGFKGVYTLEPGYAHADVHVAHCRVHGNLGDPFQTRSHTGNGIIISSTDGATVEYCRAYNNGGGGAKDTIGPYGIWAWHANNVAIQFNIAHHNKTAGWIDGGGFDLDGGVTNSIMQYNYAYDNDGAGYLLAQFKGARPSHNNVVRYNISANDGRKNKSAGIVVWAAKNESISQVDIYGNTIYTAPTENGTPAAIKLSSEGLSRITLANNLMVTTGGIPLIKARHAFAPSAVAFRGNAYWTEGAFQLQWGPNQFDSLKAWRLAAGQEVYQNRSLGLYVPPDFVSVDYREREPLGDSTVLHDLQAFRLRRTSPLIDAGLSLQTWFGFDPGPHDFYRRQLPQGNRLDIGAAEYQDEESPQTSSTRLAER
jgi:hypothetical protein